MGVMSVNLGGHKLDHCLWVNSTAASQIISWNNPVFLKPISNDLGPVPWRITILENYIVVSVQEALEWLQMVSK